MFQIIAPAAFVTAPWKNGGGVTHQIACDAGDPWAWRFSIAEVASDGPFSRFDGLSRILTVIDGAGVVLRAGDWTVTAGLGVPVAFSGDLAVDSTLVAGPIRDLNVIYDAARVAATVDVLRGAGAVLADGLTGVLALSGGVAVDGRALLPGHFALGDQGRAELAADGVAVVVRVRSRPPVP